MNSNSDFAIITKDLTKTFDSIKAVDSISLEIEKGIIFGLIGPNGAGKTTLIRLLLGLLTPDKGQGYTLGYPITALPQGIKKKIGYMPQTTSLYPDLTVKENIEFFAKLNGVTDRKVRAEYVKNVIELVAVEKWTNMLVSELSGGTQRRVSLGCALVHNPDLLFLDEPTVGVSPNLRKTFWSYFKKLAKEGKTVIVTTHYLEEAMNCDKVALMHNGRILAVGSITEIMSLLPYGKTLVINTLKEVTPDFLEQLKSHFDISIVSSTKTKIGIGYSDDSIVDDIILFLKKTGIAMKSIELKMPTLDDVFIYLIEKQKLRER